MKEIIYTVIQAVVQGLSEFLPISSSGHISIVSHLFGYSESSTMLMVVLHLGTLFAVFIAFRDIIWALIKEFFVMIKDIFTGKFKWKTMNPQRRMIMMLIVACIPLVPVYIFLGDFFTGISEDNDILIEGFCFLYTALILFLSTRCIKGSKTAGDMNAKDALTVGIFQCVALFPGVSRSGSTISSGLFCGLSRETAVSFSFILGIPPILAGAAVEFKDTISSTADINWLAYIIGFIIAAVVGFLAIKLVQWLVKSDKFIIFSIYTLILGIAVIAIAVIEKVNGVENILQLFA
ncbi:MAG: undecaprenyl-diphosphate phosphatase [Oscillospiraceae bacterium]